MNKVDDPIYGVQSPFHAEWDGYMTLREMEYRNEVPEGRVVEKLQEWIKAYGWVPAQESLRLWLELEKALADLEEERVEKIRIAQERFDARFGRMNPYVPEITSEDNKEFQKIFAGETTCRHWRRLTSCY